MKITFDADELRPLITAIVAEAVAALQDASAKLPGDRLAFTEADAAAALGIRGHQLRDARLRGEIVATKIGGRIGYERAELIAYLRRGREAMR